MPRRDGLALLEDLKGAGDRAPVVMMSGQANIEMAVRATRLGALDFLEKPLSTEKLLVTLENALKLTRLEAENRELRTRVGKHAIVWTGENMRRVMAQIERVAASESRVCILRRDRDRQGTVARTLHERSPRRRTVRHFELRSRPRRVDRERAVRPRKGLVHRGGQAPHRQIRAGAPRDTFPRRDRRHARRHAGQALARARRRRGGARRRRQADHRWTCASLSPLIAISNNSSKSAHSAVTCFIAWSCFPWSCRRCASVARTCRRWSSTLHAR